MSESPRDVLTISDSYKAAAGRLSGAFAGAKVLGHLNGRTHACTTSELQNVGASWVYTEVGSGATAGVMQTPTATLPALLKFTTGATQHNNQQIQWAKAQTAGSTTASEYAPFLCVTGRNIHFRARIEITSTFANAAFFVGLAKVSTTLFSSSAASASEMIGFYKTSGNANIVGLQRGASTNTTTTLQAGAINTWYDLEIKITDRSGISYWINGVKVSEGTVTNMPANTVPLSPSFVISAGTAAAATMLVQGLLVVQDCGI